MNIKLRITFIVCLLSIISLNFFAEEDINLLPMHGGKEKTEA